MDEQGNVIPAQGDLQRSQPVVKGKRFLIRAFAWIIDLVFMYAANRGIGIILGLILGLTFIALDIEISDVEGTLGCINLLAAAFLSLVYAVSFEALYSATLGKLILGLRVIKIDGTACDLWAALIRGLFRFVDAFLFGVVALFSMKDPLYQRVGDQVAKTLVVSSRDPVVQEKRDWSWLIVAGLIYAVINGIVQLVITLPIILRGWHLCSLD